MIAWHFPFLDFVVAEGSFAGNKSDGSDGSTALTGSKGRGALLLAAMMPACREWHIGKKIGICKDRLCHAHHK